MTYQDIENANKQLSKIDIKGKEYVSVNERIKAFRYMCPMGTISTELVSVNDGVCIIKASVLDQEGNLLGTGYSYEKEGSSFINKTSYIENCETSAVGRALGMCGIGIDTSLATFEEVKNAQLQQEEIKPIDKAHVNTIVKTAEKVGVPLEKIVERYKVNTIDEMTLAQFNTCMKGLETDAKAQGIVLR